MPQEKLIDAIDALLPVLLQGMDAMGFIARHLHPPLLPSLAEQAAPIAAKLKQARAPFDAIDWPEELRAFAAHVREAADETEAAFEGLNAAADDREAAAAGGPVFAA